MLAALIVGLAALGGVSTNAPPVQPGPEPRLPPPAAPAPPGAPRLALTRRQAEPPPPPAPVAVPAAAPGPPAVVRKPKPAPMLKEAPKTIPKTFPKAVHPKPKPSPPRQPVSEPVRPGQQARIVPGSAAYLAVDQQAFSELRQQGRLPALIRGGLLFTAPPGAVVQVLETDGRQALVRTGGRVGWVAVSALEAAKP